MTSPRQIRPQVVLIGLALGLGAVCAGNLSGCARSSSSMYPFEPGHRWTYSVRAGFLTRVEEVKVLGPATVAGGPGWILGGEMGRSRLAWQNQVLVAEELPGTRLSPPLPILDLQQQPGTFRRWRGILTANGRPFEATAELTMASTKLKIAGRDAPTSKTTLVLKLEDRSVELISWYIEGTGLVRQEQRTNGLQDRALEYLTGP